MLISSKVSTVWVDIWPLKILIAYWQRWYSFWRVCFEKVGLSNSTPELKCYPYLEFSSCAHIFFYLFVFVFFLFFFSVCLFVFIAIHQVNKVVPLLTRIIAIHLLLSHLDSVNKKTENNIIYKYMKMSFFIHFIFIRKEIM